MCAANAIYLVGKGIDPMKSAFKLLSLALLSAGAVQAYAQPANLPPPGGETPIAFDVQGAGRAGARAGPP